MSRMAEYIDKAKAVENIKKLMSSIPAKDNYAKGYDAAIGRALIAVRSESATDVQPIDKNNMHIISIGGKAYQAENTIMEFMKKMDIIRDSLAHIEKYFDTYAETIRQINACVGRCTDITEIKYFIDRIKENSGYD